MLSDGRNNRKYIGSIEINKKAYLITLPENDYEKEGQSNFATSPIQYLFVLQDENKRRHWKLMIHLDCMAIALR